MFIHIILCACTNVLNIVFAYHIHRSLAHGNVLCVKVQSLVYTHTVYLKNTIQITIDYYMNLYLSVYYNSDGCSDDYTCLSRLAGCMYM